MRDDDFNRFMGGQGNSKHFAIIFLVCILMTLLLVWSVASAKELPYVDERCAFSFACQEKVYQLWYWGQVLSSEDLTAEECQAELEMLEPQIKPFGGLECRERVVERQKS